MIFAINLTEVHNMKNLLSTIVVLVTAIFISTSVSAIAASPSDRDIEAHKAQFMEKLEVTDEQYDSVSSILDEEFVAIQEVRDKYMSQGRSRENRKLARAEIQDIKENTKLQLSEVLTDEQMEKYEQIENHRKSDFKNQRKNQGGGGFGKLGSFVDSFKIN